MHRFTKKLYSDNGVNSIFASLDSDKATALTAYEETMQLIKKLKKQLVKKHPKMLKYLTDFLIPIKTFFVTKAANNL